jgi:hypothetical protein
MAITNAIKERLLREAPELSYLQRQAVELAREVERDGPAQAAVLGTSRQLQDVRAKAGAIILDLLDRATNP